VTICDFAKNSDNEDGYRKLQKSFFMWFFVTAGLKKLQKSGFNWLF
jgi:hypothetical protein